MVPAPVSGALDVRGRWSRSLPAGATVCCTARADGDLGDRDPGALSARRAVIVDRPWTALRQVHGAGVVVVQEAGDGVGVEADAAVSAHGDVALAVLTADCAPVALASPEGVIGVAHAGWRGLVAGVIGATVDAMVALGAGEIHAVVGPCIHPSCYSFPASDLDAAVAAGGAALRGTDRLGGPALDLPAGVITALRRAGAVVDAESGICTACSPDHWSWRARRDTARQATVIWRS